MTENEPQDSGENYRVETSGVPRGARVGSSFADSEMAEDYSRQVQTQIKEESSSCCSCTCKDIREVLPSCIILIVGLAIMVLVIPYAFSSVIKQIQLENSQRNITSNITKGEE